MCKADLDAFFSRRVSRLREDTADNSALGALVEKEAFLCSEGKVEVALTILCATMATEMLARLSSRQSWRFLSRKHFASLATTIPRVNQDRLWGDIHHTAQWGHGPSWGT